MFRFVQFEFGFLLGPGDGRYMVRDPERVLVLGTLGAPQRRFRDRKGRALDSADPEPVPTSRATVIDTEVVSDRQAERWLGEIRSSPDSQVSAALAVLNRALHAHRVARADASARDVSEASALIVRVGFGEGESVADGRFEKAWELPRGRVKVKRSMESPDERFAAILGGRQQALVGEELVLRVRADLDGGRRREAALQARVALESLVAELPSAGLDEHRTDIGEMANAALAGDLDESAGAALARVLDAMEAALRRHRLGT